jgi:GNAT superfamily N-acetyltransferase
MGAVAQEVEVRTLGVDEPGFADVAMGVALVFPSPMTVQLDELWVLRDLYVAKGHRGRGAGRALSLAL